jgi:hypothetical protein
MTIILRLINTPKLCKLGMFLNPYFSEPEFS